MIAIPIFNPVLASKGSGVAQQKSIHLIVMAIVSLNLDNSTAVCSQESKRKKIGHALWVCLVLAAVREDAVTGFRCLRERSN